MRSIRVSLKPFPASVLRNQLLMASLAFLMIRPHLNLRSPVQAKGRQHAVKPLSCGSCRCRCAFALIGR
jgi:hypothetical protein